MPESLPSPEESRGENKLFGRHKWRGKLFSADSRFGRGADNLESTDEDIANFLHTVDTRPEAGPQSSPLAPRIDVAAASRIPSSPQAIPDNFISDVYRRAKPRQNKGLRVRFESAPSAVIGFGGDEAELPSRYVSGSFTGSVRSDQSPTREPSHYRASDQRPEADFLDETSFRPSSRRRRPTGIDDELLAEESHHVGRDREEFQSAFAGIRKLSPRSRNQEQDLDLKLRERDARPVSYNSASASEDLSYDQSHTGQTAEIRRPRVTRHFGAPPPETLPADSVAPTEPPESPYVSQEVSSSSYYFPPGTEDLPKLQDSGHQGMHQDNQDASQSPREKLFSLRREAKSLGDESLDDFDSRVRRFNDLFRLNASADVDILTVSFERWVRTSAWWFLRGREGLESAVRSKSSSIAAANAANDRDVSSTLKQAYINLAKAWWILKDVTLNLPEIRSFGNAIMSSMIAVIRSSGNQALAELVEVHLGIVANMRALAISMKKNGRLPPNDLQMQRLESQIFLESPTFPLDHTALMANNLLNPSIKDKNYVANPFFPILVGDTERHFSFGNMFVDTVFDSHDDAKSGLHIPCVMSVMRERTDWAVKAAVTSQDGQVNLVIESGGGLHWHNVQWQIPLNTMQVRLAEDTSLQIKFSVKDFKTIWGICDYTQQIRKGYSSRSGEEILYECKLPNFQCFDSPSFPAEPIKDCRVRLFKKKVVAVEGSGQHRAHDGYRLMVVTPPGMKTLSNVNYQLGKDSPILFSTHPSKGGSTLLVRVPSSLTLSLTFHEASDVELFRSTLAGTLITEDDYCSAFLGLQNFTINSVSADLDMVYMNASRCFSDLRWRKLRVVNKGPPSHGHDSQSTIRSVRILVDCHSGTFTDRVNVGPGELQLNLGVENLNEIKLLRAAQQDMTWSFADSVLREADLSSLSQTLHTMGMSASVRTYHFRSLSDLHSFQTMLTGFHVLYDGLASTFSISRPRMVVPLHKRWEASTPRLQIIKQDKSVQLVVFFKDFSHGACMNFFLKVTDVFDTFARSGGFFLRIVDAKFALPKGDSDPARDFVCLDMPEYPGEHDDITIGFDNDQGNHSRCSSARPQDGNVD